MLSKEIKGSNWTLRVGDNNKEFEDRFCLHCGKKLAQRNRNKFCFAHILKYGREWRENV